MWQYAYQNLYFGQKKKYQLQVRYWTFTINCFLEHKWYLCPFTAAVAYMCCIHVYCDIHLWWLYNTLENYKLHHPSNASNDNTRTMQKQLSNKFQAGTAKSAFFCACTHKMQIVVGKCKIAHSFLKNKIINKSDWRWQRWLCDWVTQLVRLQCFQGVLVTGVRFRLNKISSFKHAIGCSRTST